VKVGCAPSHFLRTIFPHSCSCGVSIRASSYSICDVSECVVMCILPQSRWASVAARASDGPLKPAICYLLCNTSVYLLSEYFYLSFLVCFDWWRLCFIRLVMADIDKLNIDSIIQRLLEGKFHVKQRLTYSNNEVNYYKIVVIVVNEYVHVWFVSSLARILELEHLRFWSYELCHNTL